MYIRKNLFILFIVTSIATLCTAQKDLAYLANLENTRIIRKSNVLDLREKQLDTSRKLFDIDIQKTQLTFSKKADINSEKKKLNSQRNSLYQKKCMLSLQKFAAYVDLAIVKAKIYWHLARNSEFNG